MLDERLMTDIGGRFAVRILLYLSLWFLTFQDTFLVSSIQVWTIEEKIVLQGKVDG